MKNYRKLFALLMTLVMLIGMVPTGYAEAPEGSDSCRHNWSYRYPNGRPTNCQDERLCEEYCTKCTMLAGSWMETGDHQFGYASWDGNPPSNCQDTGIQNMYCGICGDCYNEREIRGDHVWSDWSGTAGTCLEPGREERSCYYCGTTEYRTGNTGAHQWGDWVKTKDGTCVEAGKEERTCGLCGKKETRDTTMGDHKWGNWVTVKTGTCLEPGREERSCNYCSVTEYRNGNMGAHQWGDWVKTKDGTCVEAGKEERTCGLCGKKETRDTTMGDHSYGSWKDDTKPTCTDKGLQYRNCTRCGDAKWRYSDKIDHIFGEWYVVLEPKVGIPGVEERTCTMCGLPEQREIPGLEEGYIYIPGGTPAPGGVVVPDDSGWVTINPTPTPDPEYVNKNDDPNWNNGTYVPGVTVDLNGLTVIKSAPRGSHSNYYYPGEQVPFTITVTNNTGVELVDVEITDPLKGSNEDAVVDRILSMQPGEIVTVTFNYTTTEADAAIGVEGFENTAYATGYTSDGTQVNGTSNTVFVWCVVEHGVHISKSVANTPANGEFFVPGETIEFAISVDINDSPYPLYAIVLTDPLCEDQYTYDAANEMSYLYFGNLGNALGDGDSVTVTVKYVVTEADAEAGSVTNTATVNYQTWYGEEMTASASATAKCGKGNPTVTFAKHAVSVPANGEYFVVGEQIEYCLEFDSFIGDPVPGAETASVYNIKLFDPLYSQSEPVYTHPEAWDISMPFYHTVTEEDAQRGYVENTAYVTFSYQPNGAEEKIYSNTITLPCGFADDGAVSLIKEMHNTPANGMYYVPGEWIHFLISLKNNTDTDLTGVVLTDPLAERTFEFDLVPANNFVATVAYYKVTEQDAFTGSVMNYASASAYAEDGYYNLISNVVTVPCGYPEGDAPFGVLTGLEVTKEVESLPLNGKFYQPSETVAYKITYTNSGETLLTDVMIYDALAGFNEVATAETLQPGESRVCYVNYTVTVADTAVGSVTNTAVGQYVIGGYVNTVPSNTVVVPANAYTSHQYVPGTPEDGKYDPGTGWVDIIVPGGSTSTTTPGGTTGEGTPVPGDPSVPGGTSFGTIDVDKLRNGDPYCVRTILGKDNASASYEISFCLDHVDTQSSALLMSQAAAAPELKMQAAAYAVALWRTEVETLYQEILDVSDSAAKSVVMTEYIRFLTEVANYEALLKVVYPDQPAVVAQKIAAMWEDKCVNLCYEMHAPASERKDSLLSVTATAGAAAVECTCVTTSEVNGTKAYTQNYCPTHGFTFSMIDALLKGKDTAEAWTTVRQIWGVELSAAYNKITAKLGDNKALAQAEYNALTQWMMSREAALIALYPDNYEVVAQTMVKLIMDRVSDLCQIVK